MLKEKGFYRGINLGGWLSQCDYSDTHLNCFITEPDFAKIASWGLDHVRIPVDYNILENEDGTYKNEGFNIIAGALTLCKKYHLNMVLDCTRQQAFHSTTIVKMNMDFLRANIYKSDSIAFGKKLLSISVHTLTAWHLNCSMK